MALIPNKFLYFSNLTLFQAKLTAGDINDKHIAFIESLPAIWTHGKFYYANTKSYDDLKAEFDGAYVAKETGKGLSTNDYTDADKALVQKIKTPMNYKGSVATYQDLLAITDAQTGDVYNVTADGKNYAWDGSAWDLFGLMAIDIVNNLTTGGENVALSAEQGKTLKGLIDKEVSDRTTAVSTVSDALAEEITNRTQNVATEVARAKAAEDKIEASVGLAADGSFTAPTDKNYISDATSVMDAVEKLDAQTKANADAVAALAGSGSGSIADQINAVKDTIDAYTVNGKAISTNPVLNGADVALTGYTAVEGGLVAATDSVNAAINKIDEAFSWYEEEVN